MAYVEIELGVAGNGYGYIAHLYSEPFGGEYGGVLGSEAGFDGPGDARREAEAWLDSEYGADGWEHI